MIKYFLPLIILFSSGFAEYITIDPSSRDFSMRPKEKTRVDIFDFAGLFPELANIDVNARKKKNVKFYLTGDYPLLEKVNYEGSFGILKGELTGNFPRLSLINFLCSSCAMDLNLSAHWQQSCEIHIRGENEDIALDLPKDVGLVIHTKTGLKGKVIASEGLKKQNRYGVINKIFENAQARTSSIVLTIYIQTENGHIILN